MERGSDFIYSQTQPEQARLRLGAVDLAYGGCGPVACYNVLRLLGDARTALEDILQWYQSHHGLLFGGRLGSTPWAAARYLKGRGCRVTFLFRREKQEKALQTGRPCILWYAYRSGKRPQAHFVALQSGDGGIRAYNVWSNQRRTVTHTGGFGSFLTLLRARLPILLQITRT